MNNHADPEGYASSSRQPDRVPDGTNQSGRILAGQTPKAFGIGQVTEHTLLKSKKAMKYYPPLQDS
jgi:hypothetical protein